MKILSPIWYIHQNNADPSRFLHIYTRKVSLPHSKHYYQHPIYFPLCNTDFKSVRFMLHELLRDYIFYVLTHQTSLSNYAADRREGQTSPLVSPAQYSWDVMTTRAASCFDSDLKSRTDPINWRGDHIHTICHIAPLNHQPGTQPHTRKPSKKKRFVQHIYYTRTITTELSELLHYQWNVITQYDTTEF